MKKKASLSRRLGQPLRDSNLLPHYMNVLELWYMKLLFMLCNCFVNVLSAAISCSNRVSSVLLCGNVPCGRCW